MLSKGIKLGIFGTVSVAVVAVAGALFTSQEAKSFRSFAETASQRSITFDKNGSYKNLGTNKYSLSATTNAGNTYYMVVKGGEDFNIGNEYIAYLYGSDTTSFSLEFSKDADGKEILEFARIDSVTIDIYNTTSNIRKFKLYTRKSGSTFSESVYETLVTNNTTYSGTQAITNETYNHVLQIGGESGFGKYYVKAVTITYTC